MKRCDVFNVSGPYAVGKDSILNEILCLFGDRVHRVTTITTRPVDRTVDPSYTHVEPDEFDRIVASADWIVNRQLGGRTAYATNLDEIRLATARGKLCILSVFAGPDGAGALRRALGDSLHSVGVLPSDGSLDQQRAILRSRLVGRNRDDPEALELRLNSQIAPIKYVLENPTVNTPDGPRLVFNARLVNDTLEHTLGTAIDMFMEVTSC